MQTARAPRASALKMSVPLRKPPSMMTGTRVRRGVHNFRKAVDCAATALFGSSAMVRYDHAVHSGIEAELGIFGGLDSLDQQFHLGELSESPQCSQVIAGLVVPMSATSKPWNIGLRR